MYVLIINEERNYATVLPKLCVTHEMPHYTRTLPVAYNQLRLFLAMARCSCLAPPPFDHRVNVGHSVRKYIRLRVSMCFSYCTIASHGTYPLIVSSSTGPRFSGCEHYWMALISRTPATTTAIPQQQNL